MNQCLGVAFGQPSPGGVGDGEAPEVFVVEAKAAQGGPAAKRSGALPGCVGEAPEVFVVEAKAAQGGPAAKRNTFRMGGGALEIELPFNHVAQPQPHGCRVAGTQSEAAVVRRDGGLP